ncbi:MAG: putative dienelactone hydrolase, partial [Candidatus Omnitrophota bacterium]
RVGPSVLYPVEFGTLPGPRQIEYEVVSPLKGTTYSETLPVLFFSPDVNQPVGGFRNLAARLAEWGYICVNVGHPSGPEIDPQARGNDLVGLVQEMVAGRIAPQQVLGRMDTDRMGILGHGLGSTTALKLGGLTFDHGGRNSTMMYTSTKAVVAFSPNIVGMDGLSTQSWASVRVPVMTITGSLDTTVAVPDATARKQVYEALPRGSSYQVWMDGASHNDFTDDGIKLNGLRFSDWYFQAVLAFCDARLYDDQAAARWLRAQTLQRLSQGLHQLDWK